MNIAGLVNCFNDEGEIIRTHDGQRVFFDGRQATHTEHVEHAIAVFKFNEFTPLELSFFIGCYNNSFNHIDSYINISESEFNNIPQPN